MLPSVLKTVLTANLNLNDSRILSQIVFSSDSVRPTVKSAAITDGKYRVSVLYFNVVVSTRFNGLSFSDPGDSRFRVTSEWYFDDDIFTFVKECRVAESRRNVQLRSSCKKIL